MKDQFKPMTGLETAALKQLKEAGGEAKFIPYAGLAASNRMLGLYTLRSLEKRGLVTHINSEGRSYWKAQKS